MLCPKDSTICATPTSHGWLHGAKKYRNVFSGKWRQPRKSWFARKTKAKKTQAGEKTWLTTTLDIPAMYGPMFMDHCLIRVFVVDNYSHIIRSAMASQITSAPIGCTTVCSGADQRKHQSSASRAFVRGIHRWPMDSPLKAPVTRNMFVFDVVIM